MKRTTVVRFKQEAIRSKQPQSWGLSKEPHIPSHPFT